MGLMCLVAPLIGQAARKGKRSQTLQMTTQTRQKTFQQIKVPVRARPAPRRTQPAKARPREWKKKSANSINNEKREKLRIQRIRLLRTLLQDLAIFAPKDKAQKAIYLHQLAEAYMGRAQYLSFQAIRRHDQAMAQWMKQRDTKGKRAAGAKPKIDLRKSKAYESQAMNLYKRIVALGPVYPKLPEVRFSLLLSLLARKQTQKARRVLKALLKAHPTSRFVPEAHMLWARTHFYANKVNEALTHYTLARKTAATLLKRKSTTASMKTSLRGLRLRSLYMLGWCSFNVGEYPKAISQFRTVVSRSQLYQKTKGSKIRLKSEALRDMLMVYVKMRQVDVSGIYQYYKGNIGPRGAYKTIARLARMLQGRGRFAPAVVSYRFLVKTTPSGKADGPHAHVPLMQLGAIRSGEAIWTPTQLFSAIGQLTKTLAQDSTWQRRWGTSDKGKQVREEIETELVSMATRYHQLAQQQESKKRRKAEVFYNYAIALYRSYLQLFDKAENTTTVRFFLAELLYRKGQKHESKRSKAHKTHFARASRLYQQVALDKSRKNTYRKQAQFAEILCYEQLLGVSQRWRLQAKRIPTGTKSQTQSISPTSWKGRLLAAYKRYLPLSKDATERLETYFKMGVLHYQSQQYLKAMGIFAAMVKEFPQHEQSRKAAFMVLYGYQDLKQWAALEDTARHYLKHKILTKSRAFRKELFDMLLRAAYLPRYKALKKQMAGKGKVDNALLTQLEGYEREFGVEGTWRQKGFPVSPRASFALALAGAGWTRNKRLFRAIKARARLVKRYKDFPSRIKIMSELGMHYAQIADYKEAASWLERYLQARMNATPKRPKRRRSQDQDDTSPATIAAQWSKAQRKRVKDAMFQAATFRKGMGQWAKAVALWQQYLALFPKEPALANVRIEIARIYERAGQWAKAVEAYETYLEKHQAPALHKALKVAVKVTQSSTQKGLLTQLSGMRQKAQGPAFAKGTKPALLAKMRLVPKAALANASTLLFVYSHMARCHKAQKQPKKRWQRWIQMDAIGFQLALHRHPQLYQKAFSRQLFARARFALVDRSRTAYLSLRFGRKQQTNRKVLRKLLQEAKRLGQQYAEVAALKSTKWTLAAVFRMGELYHLFSKKLSDAPRPTSLSKTEHERYRQLLQQRIIRYEDIALNFYRRVLQESARLGSYNRWVRRCEAAKNDLMRQRGRVNPFTIFQQRRSSFWLVEAMPQPTQLFRLPPASRPLLRPRPRPLSRPLTRPLRR